MLALSIDNSYELNHSTHFCILNPKADSFKPTSNELKLQSDKINLSFRFSERNYIYGFPSNFTGYPGYITEYSIRNTSPSLHDLPTPAFSEVTYISNINPIETFNISHANSCMLNPEAEPFFPTTAPYIYIAKYIVTIQAFLLV